MTEPYSGAGSNRPGRDSSEQPRKCVDCGELFVSAVNLRDHRASAHATLYRCADCGVLHVSVVALRAHRVAAHKATLYRCAQCGARVKGYAALQRHRMIEHGSLRRSK